MADNELHSPVAHTATRRPSDATRARREAKRRLAPYVSKLSVWHPQAARLLLEVDRAARGTTTNPDLTNAIDMMIAEVEDDRAHFASMSTELQSSRVDDLAKSFTRLLVDLKTARARLPGSVDRDQE